MSNDPDGFVDDPRNGQSREDKQDAHPVKKSDEKEYREPKKVGGFNEHEDQTEAEVLELVNSMPEDQRKEFLGELSVIREWSAVLPDPDSYNKYPVETQKKMIEWNDAQILDESKRNDKLVDCFIKNQNRSQLFSFLVNMGFLIACFVSFLVTEDPVSFGFLSVPGVTIAINLWKNRKDS